MSGVRKVFRKDGQAGVNSFASEKMRREAEERKRARDAEQALAAARQEDTRRSSTPGRRQSSQQVNGFTVWRRKAHSPRISAAEAIKPVAEEAQGAGARRADS